MKEIDLVNIKGEKIGTVKVSEFIFDTKINQHAIYEAIKAYLANQRQGTHKGKSRSEVSGGGKKPWKQKGTGRARSGSNTSPIWKRGGMAFPPTPRDYTIRLPKQIKRLALFSSLSLKVANNNIVAVENLNIENIKTKDALDIINNIVKDKKKVIFYTDKINKNLYLSLRNVSKIKVNPINNINTYDIHYSDMVVFSKKALEKIEEVYIK